MNKNHVFSFNKDDVKILNVAIAYQSHYQIKKYKLQFRLFQGGWSVPIERELFVRGNAVGILIYDPKKDAVLLIEQFRLGAINDPKTPWLLEIVAGIIEGDSTPAEVAVREAKEEANCDIKELIPIYQYYSSPGGSSETFHLFCALVDSTDLSGIHGLVSENENIKVHVFSREHAYQMLATGEVINSHAIVALQWLQLNYQQLKKA